MSKDNIKNKKENSVKKDNIEKISKEISQKDLGYFNGPLKAKKILDDIEGNKK